LVVVAAPHEQDILPFPEDGLVNLQVAVVDMGNRGMQQVVVRTFAAVLGVFEVESCTSTLFHVIRK